MAMGAPPSTQPSSLGAEKLRKWLEQHSISQKDLSEEMELASRQYVTDYIQGRRKLPLASAAWLEERTCGWVRAVDWVAPPSEGAHADQGEKVGS